MNIFLLHSDPRKCARWHCDSHVVKMLLEVCQLLYTAHWALEYSVLSETFSAIELSRVQKMMKIPESLQTAPDGGYRPVHIHHPCAVWARRTHGNYVWLCLLAVELSREYTFRYNKIHSCDKHVNWLIANIPQNIRKMPRTNWPIAMDRIYKINSNAISCYRHFYKVNKGSKGLLKYTRRNKPHWIYTDLSYK